MPEAYVDRLIAERWRVPPQYVRDAPQADYETELWIMEIEQKAETFRRAVGQAGMVNGQPMVRPRRR